MIKLILISFILFSSQTLALGITKVIDVYYVCDSDIKESVECNNLTDYDLIERAKSMVPTTKTEECLLNPLDITCGANFQQPGSVTFTTYSARNGTIDKRKVNISPFGVTIQNTPPTTVDLDNAQQSQEANELYLYIKKSLQFKQSSTGVIIDGNNNTPLNANGSAMTRLGNCRSALSYATNDRFDSSLPSCQSFLNSFIINEWQKAGSPMSSFKGFLKSLSLNIPGFTYEFSDATFNFVIKFSDRSLLSLQIILPNNPNGYPSIVLDKNASHTSSLETLQEFLASDSSPNSNVSHGELVAYLGSEGVRDSCSTNLQAIGYYVDYLIVTTEYPDGTVKYSVQRLGSSPIYDIVTTCWSTLNGS